MFFIVVKSDAVCSDHSRHSAVLRRQETRWRPVLWQFVQLVLWCCSYRGFPQPTLSTPCDPGSQSGRPGSLSPNQSDQSWASSHLGSTRELGGELNEDLYILLFDLQKDYVSVFMMLNETYYGVFPTSKQKSKSKCVYCCMYQIASAQQNSYDLASIIHLRSRRHTYNKNNIKL